MAEDWTKTVRLTDASTCNVLGERRSIADMAPEEAIAIFGLPVYEAWLEAKANPRPGGTCIVTSIGRDSLTMEYVPGPEPKTDDYIFKAGSPSGSEGDEK